ncbi:hypothetical protein [Microbispora sp. NPDC049125]|uniref:hypothetical protein n=1 Tax=Microbispora sp. NPDC049125 TaxID=3154929 RepID=UPI0034674C76
MNTATSLEARIATAELVLQEGEMVIDLDDLLEGDEIKGLLSRKGERIALEGTFVRRQGSRHLTLVLSRAGREDWFAASEEWLLIADAERHAELY